MFGGSTKAPAFEMYECGSVDLDDGRAAQELVSDVAYNHGIGVVNVRIKL